MSRDETLTRIRSALGDAERAVIEIPRGYRTHVDREAGAAVQLFARRVAEYRATVHHTAPEGLPPLIAAILAASGAKRVVAPSGLPSDWLADVAEVVVVLTDRVTTTEDLGDVDAVVTGCAVAIAETGTVVLDADPDQGRRVITLLPDHHVCVVRAEQIAATVPEGLALLEPTRPLTMISGPSATSDIELERVEGVHGPRRLDVVVVAAT